RQRWATIAGTGLPPATRLRHQHRPRTLDTVLSPAVKSHQPPKDAVLPLGVTRGAVVFDTRMDTTIPPGSVIDIRGCRATIENARWNPPFTLTFDINVRRADRATLTVKESQAKAERDFKNRLDGNTRPHNTDHVGPNRDDFKWRVFCVERPDGGAADARPP